MGAGGSVPGPLCCISAPVCRESGPLGGVDDAQLILLLLPAPHAATPGSYSRRRRANLLGSFFAPASARFLLLA